MNRAQYQLSKRQAKRARRRAEAGLPPVDVIPAGPRITTASGRPAQPYRMDQRSRCYRRLDAARAWDAASATQARRDQARTIAADVVATHGYQLVVEDVRLASWSASWGRAVALFSPGTLIAAIDREARAVGALAGGRGGVGRASTATTALSQHCPCSARVDKRLADRVHDCSACGLRADRDAVSAVLASFVVLTGRGVGVGAGRLRRHGRRARRDPLRPHTVFVSGVARHPVRVNRPLGPRWFVRRVVDAHTRFCRGGSAKRWHGRMFNPE